MRATIRQTIEAIAPLDPKEARNRQDALDWVDSGVELFRLVKPDTPPKHLVSYFLVVDGDYVLLVDHVNAGLWLPSGGHIEPGEHPQTTVIREAAEELALDAEFLFQEPIFLTSTMTVGRTAGHIDVSFWYVLKGDRTQPIDFDRSEFHRVRWFHRDDVPLERCDPEMGRFLAKWVQYTQRRHE